jgi:hypothetical protein
MKIFNAIPLPPFSAALNCARYLPSSTIELCSSVCAQHSSEGKVVLNTTSPTLGGTFHLVKSLSSPIWNIPLLFPSKNGRNG